MRYTSISLLLLSLLLLSPVVNSWCYKSFFTVPGESTNMDISPDGAYMAITSSSSPNAVFVYDLNYNLLLNYKVSGQTIVTAKFTKDGIYLGVALANGVVHLLSGKATFNSTVMITITTGKSTVVDFDFNRNSNKMLLCYSNKYDIYNNYAGGGVQTNNSNNVPNNIIHCSFGYNDEVGLIDTNKFVRVYSTLTTAISSSNNFKDFDFRMAAGTAKFIVVGGSDTKSHYAVNNASSLTQNTGTLSGSNNFNSACYSGDNLNYAFGGASDNRAFIYADNNTLIQIFKDSTESLISCSFTPDGSYLYYGTAANNGFSFVHIYKNNCFQCPLGSYLTGFTTCTLCTSGANQIACAACTTATTCTACFPGYYLNQTNSQCYKCDYAMEGCSTCANASFCLQCNTNYYVNATNFCQSCISTQPGCLACSNSTTCYVCSQQHYLNGSSCTRCNIAKTNCLRCTNSSTCIQCQFGFYLSSGSCVACSSNCTLCFNAANNCSGCARGFYVSSFACTPCTTDCLDCNATNFCYDCRIGTYLTSTGTCSYCTFPCNTCNSSSSCLTCVPGTYLSGTTCISCTTNCTTCLNSTNCSACNLGYYLSSSNNCLNCRFLFNNCTTCNRTQCFACEVGYYLHSNNTCQSCATQGCTLCNSSSICQVCALGYFLTASNTCTLCNIYCDSCYTSASNCSSCIPGYYLSGSTCLGCSNNCQTCNGTACFSCNLGYYLSSGSCVACKGAIYGCINCVNGTYCNECQMGKYLNSSYFCSQCSALCGSCNSTACLSCNLGYYLSSNQCSKCMDNCSECHNSTNCFSCTPGYYFNSTLTSNQCTSCKSLSRGCLTCNSTACLSCQLGFYLNTTTNMCAFCQNSMVNCLFCVSSSSCQMCTQGFYLNSANSSCLSCISSIDACESCKSSTECVSCLVGYYLNGNSCTVCPSKCATCTSTACITCSFRYVYNQTDCMACSTLVQHCQICSNSSTCLRCFEGFYLSSGQCSSCQSQLVGCVYCNSLSICTNCLSGYYLGSNVCNICSSMQGCTICSSSSNCTDCSSGYALSGITCVLCSSLITNCVYCSNSTLCVQCTAGYYLNAGSCSTCSSSMTGCIYCTNSSVCTQCEGGYFLNNTICTACTVSGCQLCNNLSPTQCINCYTGYYLSNNTCLSCNTTGCLDCSQANVCLSCLYGYYLSSSVCYLCSTAMTGCNKCTSSNTCTQCQTLYYLSNNSCLSCATTLTGCGFCTNSSVCISCNSGYYLNSTALCSLCTTLSGCLLCRDSSTCIYCISGYYLSGGVCSSCSSIAQCSDCTNSTNCVSCISGYTLTSGSCVVSTSSSSSSSSSSESAAAKELKWKSYYVSATTLKHVLLAVGMKYTKINTNWAGLTISVGNKSSSTALTIRSVEWGKPNQLIFYTNNPLNFDSKPLPFKRLLVGQSIDINLNSTVQISQPLLASMLPNLLNDKALTLGYNLNDPQFYNSYINAVYNTYYYVVGLTVTWLLAFNYLLKAMCTVTHSNNHGNILGHIFALKAISISLYPTYGEYINFSFGFMTADFPWFNAWFGYELSDGSDYTPYGFLLFYENMGIFSTYLLALLVYLFLLTVIYLLCKKKQLNKQQIKKKNLDVNRLYLNRYNSLTQLLNNFFYFGLVFAGCAALQGSILNPYNIISLNGAGYVIGIVIFVATLAYCLYTLYQQWNFQRLRVFIKATFLSMAHFNPIYIFAVALSVDIILIIIQFKIKYQYIVKPNWWLASQILVNSALCIFFYMPDSLISIYTSSVLIGLVTIIQIYLHFVQRSISFNDYPFFNKQELTIANQQAEWKLNPNDFSLEKESAKSKQNLKEKDLFQQTEHKILGTDPQFSTKYTQFRETVKANDKNDKPNRRNRRFRDTNKGKGSTLSSEWSNLDLGNSL